MYKPIVIALYLSCVLFVVAFSEVIALIDYRTASASSLAKSTPVPTKCEVGGPLIICKDCRNLTQCVSATEGPPKEVLIEQCPTGQTCNSGVCATDPSTTCSPARGIPFPCQTQGVFPDPADCKKYFICPTQTGDGVAVDCPQDVNQAYGFNTPSLLCKTKLVNNNCPGLPIPICTKAGQNGPLAGNPSYYYLCINYKDVLYPLQYICPNVKTYAIGRGCV